MIIKRVVMTAAASKAVFAQSTNYAVHQMYNECVKYIIAI